MMYGSWDMESFCNFGPFFALLHPQQSRKSKFWKNEKSNWRCLHFTHAYQKSQSYDVWFLRYEAWQAEFFVILGHFLPFYLTKNPKNQNFEKMKKKYLEISLFYKSVNKNHHQMLYCSWDMARDGCNFYFSFWAIFCPSPAPPFPSPLTAQKIKI